MNNTTQLDELCSLILDWADTPGNQLSGMDEELEFVEIARLHLGSKESI